MNRPNPRYVAILAAAACVILAVGWLARPAEVAQHAAPVPSETELEQLARRAERRSLDSMTKYFAGAAHDVEASIGRLRSDRMSGVAWAEGLLVTGPLDGGGQAQTAVAVAGPAGEAGARADILGAHLPLATLRSPGGLAGLVPANRAEAQPAAGDWMIAVWRTDTEPAFAAGNFHQQDAVACGTTTVREIGSNLTFSSAMIGGGVFNIDGELLAMILPCGDRIIAMAAASVDAVLTRENTTDERLRARLGLVLAPLSVDEAAYFKRSSGLVVREVWSGSDGAAAGLKPGDIILALGATPVAALDDLQALTTAESGPSVLKVQRGGKTAVIDLRAAFESASPAAGGPGAGLTLASFADGFRITSVRAGSPAAQAGLKPGDSLVGVDFVPPRSLAQARKMIAGSKPSAHWLEIDRDGRRIGLLLR